MTTNSVLMISYSYPPMGNPGALRVAKFAKYLPDLGWHPVVVTPQNGYSPMPTGMQDHVDMPGVRVVRTFDVGGLKRATVAVGRQHIAGPQKSRLANGILLPDRDITWYPFAYWAAAKWIRHHGVKALYSTSPAITNHLVARSLARRYGLPWIADFRDPWTLSSRYQNRGIRRRWEQRMERLILHDADHICVVSQKMVEMYALEYPAYQNKIHLLRNGYDHADFADLPGPQPETPFILSHAGNLDGKRRNPLALFQAIAMLKHRGLLTSENFRFQVIGKPAPAIAAQAKQLDVTDVVQFTGLQSYAQTLALMASSSALLLIEMLPENMTTKFYEYLGAQRPILAMMPSHLELARLIRSLEAGSIVNPGDSLAIANWLDNELREFQRRGPVVRVNSKTALQFSRIEGTKILGNLLDGILTKTRKLTGDPSQHS